MAFVFQAERKFEGIGVNTSSPGPGNYNLIEDINHKVTSKKKSKLVVIPFGSESLRNELPKSKKLENENLPGPGSYYVDYTQKKIQKLTEKNKDNTDQPLYKLVETNDFFDSKEVIPLGFNTSEKRFETALKLKSNSPGPGNYNFNSSFSKEKSNFQLVNLFKSKGSPKKIQKSSEKPDIKISNKISSIPSKLQSFGYEIDKNGIVIPCEDPLKNKKHIGNKSDSVGPGEYEINQTKIWFNKGTSWAKSKTVKMKAKEDNNQNDISTQSQSRQSFELNTTQKPIKHLNRYEKELIIKNFKQRKIMQQELKEEKETNQLEKMIISNDVPGPGYYYDTNKNSSFVKKKIPEELQPYSRSSARFIEAGILSGNKPSDCLGPGSYFRDDSNIENKKIKELLKNQRISLICGNSPVQRKEKLNNNSEDNNYKPKADIVGFGSSFKSRKIKNIVDDMPGPGSYSLSYNKFNINPNNKGIFGSSEKKFAMSDRDETVGENIGPGSYIQQNNWSKIDTRVVDKLMSSPKKFVRPKVNDKGLLPREKIESNSQVLVPPVGLYNIDKINSMEYNIAKKASKFSLVNAPFSSLSVRFNEIEQLKNNIDLGPGYYYNSKKNSIKPSSSPFNSSTKKIDYKNIFTNPTGPGQYNKESYFDWNKKSFNIQFI